MSNMIDDEMRSEYDFSNAIHGKHYQSYQKGTNVVFLESDVAEAFKDSESVNHALRMLMEIAGDKVIKNLTKKFR